MSVTPTAGIVTPEAVVLEFRTGGLATRAMAKLVDVLVFGTVLSIALPIVLFASGGSAAFAIAAVSVVVFLVVVIAPAVVESMTNGSSPGKAIVGLRVVTVEGGPVTFRHALVRGLLQLVEIPLGVGVIVALANRRSQRLGDLAAGTFVISDRGDSVSMMIPTVFFPPPGTEAYCAALDVSRVDSEQFLLVRNFLLRVQDLSAAARWTLAADLATALRERCSPPPPDGMGPELFLICVCSAYQMRHGGIPDRPVVYSPVPGVGPVYGQPGPWVT